MTTFGENVSKEKIFFVKTDVGHSIDLIKEYVYKFGDVSRFSSFPPTLTDSKCYVQIGLSLPNEYDPEPISVNRVIIFCLLELSENRTQIEGWYLINLPSKDLKLDWKPVATVFTQICDKIEELVGENRQHPKDELGKLLPTDDNAAIIGSKLESNKPRQNGRYRLTDNEIKKRKKTVKEAEKIRKEKGEVWKKIAKDLDIPERTLRDWRHNYR